MKKSIGIVKCWSLILMILACSLAPVSAMQNQYKAVVFNGFALFDPDPAAVVAEQIYLDHGKELIFCGGLSFLIINGLELCLAII